MRDLQRAHVLPPAGLRSAAAPTPIRILFCLSILLFHQHLPAAELRLALDSLDANRRPTLGLSGLPDGLYAIESSTNLLDWTTVLSAPADQGTLRFTPASAPGDRVTYYRGVDLNGPVLSEVQFQVDPLVSAVTLITQEAGGRLSLTNQAGTTFTFTVEPTNVLETTAISMQLVTNFIAFPYENIQREAVVFQPEGFEFHGAGLLEIHFAQPIQELQISSFGFDGQGDGFHLLPDAVTNGTVRIPVTHFSGVGTGLWEPSQRTAAVTRHVENSRNAQSHRLAGILGQERQRLLLGQEPDPSAMESLTQSLDDYYRQNLEPYFEEAKHDCALAQFLLREILGVERQKALLGVDVENSGSLLNTPLVAEWTCNCLREAIQACEEGRISDRTLIRTLLGIERQAQLLGGGNVLEGCGFASLDSYMEQLQNQSLPCVPDWFGYLKYADSGTRTWDCANTDDQSCTATTSTSLAFEADVETATIVEEFSFPPFYTMERWRLKFVPNAAGSFTHDQQSSMPVECGATITTTSHTSGSGSGNMVLYLEFTIENEEVIEVILSHDMSLELPCSEMTKTVITPCSGSESGSSSEGSFSPTTFIDAHGAGDDEIQFAVKTPVAIEGAASFQTTGIDAIPLSVSWSFSVRRR